MISNIIGGGKRLIKRYGFLYSIFRRLYKVIQIRKSLLKTTLDLKHIGNLKKDIIGINNTISVGADCRLNNLSLRIRGNNNTLIIKEGCFFGKGCSIWMEGNNTIITIGTFSTFTERCHINAQEDNSVIKLGNDCMLSNNIIIRTSDSHPIYDMISKQRINNPMPVVIGNHVWIAPNTKIMKGAIIADGCIIGSDTTVSKEFTENNSLIIGRPARIVKKNVYWTREQLF